MPDIVTTPLPPNAAAPAPSEADSPFYKDKALFVAAAAFLLPILNAKFGLGLETTDLVAAIGPLAAFILGNKWKSGAIKVAEIKARNVVTLPADLTPSQAAALMAQLGALGVTAARVLALVLTVGLLLGPSRAFAQELGDAPYAMQKGEAAPADGVFLTTARAGATFKECAEAKKNAADLEAALTTQPGTPFAAIAISAGLGIAVGVVVTFLVVRRT